MILLKSLRSYFLVCLLSHIRFWAKNDFDGECTIRSVDEWDQNNYWNLFLFYVCTFIFCCFCHLVKWACRQVGGMNDENRPQWIDDDLVKMMRFLFT